MSGSAGLARTANSRSPRLSADRQRQLIGGATASEGGGQNRVDASNGGRNVSVDDLLDYTWHYQCVVSPTFSTAALAAALININYISGSSGSCINIASDQEIRKKSAASHVEHPVLRKLNLKVMDALICNTGSTDDQDGYVSLASLIINSPSSTSSCVTSPTADDDQISPHHHHHMGLFNFVRKPSKSMNTIFTSTTCRDSARRSMTSRRAAADSTHLINYGLYATCLTVD